MIAGYSYPCVSGVWGVAYEMSRRLVEKGHEVHIFSSNEVFGSDKKSGSYEKYKGIHIHRFPVKWKIGKFGVSFDFEKELKKIKPNVIHAHVYRAPFAHKALKVAKKLGIKCFLTTHAPFVEKKLRSGFTNLMVGFYDMFFGKKDLNGYTKVLAITKWEIPYLLNLGCDKGKILYLPNGLSDDFLKVKLPKKNEKKILFFGRIDPIKDVETLVRAASLVEGAKFEIVGPYEKEYLDHLKNLVEEMGLDHVSFKEGIFGVKKKINLYKQHGIFVLPSKREAMPLAVLEAMSCGCLVIGSNNKGCSELIGKDRGFLFDVGDHEELAKKLLYCLDNINRLKGIRKEGKNFTKKFSWQKIVDKLERLYLGK